MTRRNKITIRIRYIATLGVLAGAFSLTIEGQEGTGSRYKHDQEMREFAAQFPTALYEPPVISDVTERNARAAKSKRYDNQQGLVIPEEPHHDDSSALLFDEAPGLRHLPVKASNLIVVGRVVEARAYLSNDRKDVYSEFTIEINEVLKDKSKRAYAKSIMADRLGGHVIYPNGKRRLHSVSGLLMPRVGRQYLLFLGRPDESPNFAILSGYELAGDKISRLNRADIFLAFEGVDPASFKTAVRREIAEAERASRK